MKYVKTFFYLIARIFILSTFIMSAEAALGQKSSKKSGKKVEASAKSAKSDSKTAPPENSAAKTDSAAASADKSKVDKSKATKTLKKKRKKRRNRRRKRTRLLPETRRIVRAANSGYKQCQKKSFKLMKSNQITPKQFKIQINACRERFPGAGLYVNCKKKVLRALGKTKKAKSKIKRCKRLLLAASFNQDEPIPYFIHKKKIYFAGIGFNKSQKLDSFSIPNFDCKKVEKQIKTPTEAEHILFGNHPVWFSKLRGKNQKTIKKLLKLEGDVPEDGFYAENFGKIFGDPTENDATMFFPSANCIFSGNLGDIFGGLSAYYLLDSAKNAVTPYFAITFYKPGLKDKGITTAKVLGRMKEMLGDEFSVIHKTESHTVLAASKINSFDDEGDPKNVCKTPRKHDKIAIIKSRTGNGTEPEFVLLANIKMLCSYGDRLSRRL